MIEILLIMIHVSCYKSTKSIFFTDKILPKY
jgi:hypothetical protein